MIIMGSALSYPRSCLMTDQLFHSGATQTAETKMQIQHNMVNNANWGGKPVGYLQALPKDL